MIRAGEPVSIKPAFRDPGDDFAYVAHSDEEKGRVDIVALNSGLPLPPINTVTVDMLEDVEVILLTSEAAWFDFAAENIDALRDEFPSLGAAHEAARGHGFVMGGGAAPTFRVRLVPETVQ